MTEPALDRRAPDVLELDRAALPHDWATAHARLGAYLASLPLDETDRERLARDAVEAAATRRPWPPGADALSASFESLHAGLERRPRPDGATPPPAPPLTRGSMVPHHVEGPRFRRRLVRQRSVDPARTHRETGLRRRALPWARAARRRRALLAVLVLLPTIVASQFLAEVLPGQGRTLLELSMIVVFGALFGWISIGFWTALAGFVLLLTGRDRFRVDALPEDPPAEIPPDVRTAIVMPICEEPVDRVFAGLRAIERSLARTGRLASFDFFVLSDTATASTAVREEEAWRDWCREADGSGRIFYRRRRVRVRRKSGNVADFCRRFGRRYRYMVTLDADSVMSGEAIVRLVRTMEARPDVGLVQTVPLAVRAGSLHARIQQFANRLYGPMFAAGLHFWQLGDTPYWGHNAIVRVDAFMEHCALPRLPGRPPLGGEILSHDFVEAAFLARGGYSVWLAPHVEGTWEELPSSLLEELARDRRWCQGNLQHMRLLLVRGLYGPHRALFLNGALSYVSALLWFLFLSLSTAHAVVRATQPPDYFPSGPSLFPEWPVWRPDWALALFAVTLAILFVPKLLSVALLAVRPPGFRAFGGAARLLASVALEFVVSTLLAPIRMAFHTRFVVANLLGRTVTWRSQTRGDEETSWSLAVRSHAATTLGASAWGVGVWWLDPAFFWWLTPIVGALVLSVPSSVLTSRARAGAAARRAGLFLVPEETSPPAEVDDLERCLLATETRPDEPADGFVRAVVLPATNALHRDLLRAPRRLRASIAARRHALAARALALGPDVLSERERREILLDAAVLGMMHRGAWILPPAAASRWAIHTGSSV